MTIGTRPLLLGYIRADESRNDAEVAEARSHLEAFADAEGFALGTVYVEHGATRPAAFSALLEDIRRDEEVWAVVVPEVRDLGDHEQAVMRRHRTDHASPTVLVARLP
jgi:DNA invertase Pin-like site-specific DNA recombinase